MADTYRSRVTITAGGVASLLTFYWTTSNTTPDGPTATEAHARVRAMLNSAAARFPTATTVAYDPVVQIFDDTTGTLVNVATAATPAAVTFTGGTNLAPLQTQFLARLSTPLFVRGRALKGRIFLPGVLVADVAVGGGPTSAAVTAWNTALGLLGTTVVTPIPQMVWSRPNALKGYAGSLGGVASRTCASTFAVQRGRRS